MKNLCHCAVVREFGVYAIPSDLCLRTMRARFALLAIVILDRFVFSCLLILFCEYRLVFRSRIDNQDLGRLCHDTFPRSNDVTETQLGLHWLAAGNEFDDLKLKR